MAAGHPILPRRKDLDQGPPAVKSADSVQV